MRSTLPARERAVWIAVVAVLAIAVSWMAVLELAWVTHALAARPAWVAVARAIGHVVWSAASARPLASLAGSGLGVAAALLAGMVRILVPGTGVAHV